MSVGRNFGGAWRKIYTAVAWFCTALDILPHGRERFSDTGIYTESRAVVLGAMSGFILFLVALRDATECLEGRVRQP
jgi:hypothetical protein